MPGCRRAVRPCFLLALLACAARAGDETPAPSPGGAPESELDQLRRRVEDIERRLPAEEAKEVDLSGKEVPYGALPPATHPLARPWYQNLELRGFAAFDFIATGKDGARPHGSFLVKEASLFLDAQVWTNVSLFADLQIKPPLGGYGGSFALGEVYARFANLVQRGGEDRLGVEVGRFYLPFGEEFRFWRSPENPLITNSAPFAYGIDEGVLIYGKRGKLDWTVSVTDGSEDKGIDDNWDKAVNVQVSARPWDRLYLSASFMRTGKTGESAFAFGESPLTPVGFEDPSTLGVSPSTEVKAYLYEVDARIRVTRRGHLALSFGQAFLNDAVNAFDRRVTWFSAEAVYEITPRIYAAVRYSEAGTYRSDEGYHLNGGFTAEGNEAFGYDTRRLQRVSLGLGFRPNPRVILKGEVGGDWFHLVRGSAFDAGDGDDRLLAGAEVVVVF